MDERLTRLEAQLEEVASRLSAVERRLAALETRPAVDRFAGAIGTQLSDPSRPEAGPSGPRESDLSTIVTRVGRTLVVLAGAYLLRALTDSGLLAAGPGVFLGLLFALVWLVVADRAGARRQTLRASFHGAAYVLIALPLLYEATARFRLLDPAAAAASLAGCAALGLGVAARRHLRALAWVVTLGALGTAVALMLFTAALGPFALFLVLLGVATLWLGYVLDWTFLRWPVALVADLTILILSGRSVTAGVADSPGMAISVQLLLLVAYLGSFASRTLSLRRDVIPFEIAQSVLAIAVGIGGASYVARTTHVGTLPLGLATVAVAAGCYGVAVAFVERRQGRRRNFFFYTSAGLVFALVGGLLVLPKPALALTYAALGLVTAWAGRRSRRVTFHAHGAVFLVAAGVVSDLVAHALYGLGLPVAPVLTPSATTLGVLGLCGVAIWALGTAAPESPPAAAARLPRLVVLVLGLGGLLGVAVTWLALALPGGQTEAMHAALVATLRTALLVSGILALAWAGRTLRFVEGAWLVYPLLVLTGVKFLLEDFRSGRPSTLFLGFALYGLALIVGPWLCRRPSGAEATPLRGGQT
ncbi:MAG: hypothetical protein HY712_07190 [candidate division NC10 bacterium]|nr:hypothetical protein [candidate division NC10 bacterium]